MVKSRLKHNTRVQHSTHPKPLVIHWFCLDLELKEKIMRTHLFSSSLPLRKRWIRETLLYRHNAQHLLISHTHTQISVQSCESGQRSKVNTCCCTDEWGWVLDLWHNDDDDDDFIWTNSVHNGLLAHRTLLGVVFTFGKCNRSCKVVHVWSMHTSELV